MGSEFGLVKALMGRWGTEAGRLCYSLLFALLAGEGLAEPVVPSGFEVSLYAQDELLSNPVAMAFDREERLFVAEARRKETGVWGVTFSRWWSMEDYQASTMQDRREMYERWAHIVPDSQLRAVSEIVRVVSDRDGDGRADHSAVFAEGFNEPLDGNAAGILAVDGSVYLTCIPHLWRLEDRDHDFRAEIREQLHSGFGVRVGVHGHDLHGLIQGPDGKLYFTIGDRGFDVSTEEGERFHESHCGAVFRCFPDGSGLEVFHTGLRNPQELAFNDWGDLFTVDNNMSGGDECRVLHLLEGADSGWDATFQLSGHFREETARPDHPKPTWFSERLWAPADSQVPQWHNAAVANLSRGPSGLAYYPGTGLSRDYEGTFFLADFVGNPATSEVMTFRLEPAGAGYRLKEQGVFAKNVLATDIEFGPDGALYVADWINGWTGVGAGRVWKVGLTQSDESSREVRTRLRKGFDDVPSATLVDFLGHPDRRLRYQAQFQLVRRGAEGEMNLVGVLSRSEGVLAKIHALWGLGQMAERRSIGQSGVSACLAALEDVNLEVRAQAAKVCRFVAHGDHAVLQLQKCLEDKQPRVVYQALLSLATVEAETVLPAVLACLSSEMGGDRTIRHAAVTYLVNQIPTDRIAALASDSAPQVRLSSVLALRQLRSPLIRIGLSDREDRIRYAALRAIHDLPIEEDLPIVALLVNENWTGPDAPLPIARRVVNANFRQGQAMDAFRLALLAGRVSVPHAVRLEALQALLAWNDPSVFDRVTWNLRAPRQRRAVEIGQSIRSVLGLYRTLVQSVDRDGDGLDQELLVVTSRVLIEHGLLTVDVAQRGLLQKSLPDEVRLAFLNYLIAESELTEALASAVIRANEPSLAPVAAVALAKRGDLVGWQFFAGVWEPKQASLLPQSIDLLATLDRAPARDWLAEGLRRATRGDVIGGAWLNLAEASKGVDGLARVRQSFLSSIGVSPSAVSMALVREGGDRRVGKRLFEQHAAQCQRCHQISGNGGKAGPDLTVIGKTLSSDQIVEALLEPSKRIAPGFGSVTLDLADGDVVTGIVKEEDRETLVLELPDLSVRAVSKNTIEIQSEVQSSMPPMGDVLSLREVRDLVAYLMSLR